MWRRGVESCADQSVKTLDSLVDVVKSDDEFGATSEDQRKAGPCVETEFRQMVGTELWMSGRRVEDVRRGRDHGARDIWELFQPDGDWIPYVYDQLENWGECDWDPLSYPMNSTR